MRRLLLPVAALVTLPLVPVDANAAPAPECWGSPATIVGTQGNDVIELTPKRDVVVALGGDDRVFNPLDTGKNQSVSDPAPFDAPKNDDVVCLAEGNDYAKGAHTVYGGPGDDAIYRGDTVDAGPGDDLVKNEGCRPAVVQLGDGDDRFRGFGSWDEGYEGEMGNSPYNRCSQANDEVHGGPGNDIIFGGDGDDRLFGDDAGEDSLNGWMGSNDRCIGGPEDEIRFCEGA